MRHGTCESRKEERGHGGLFIGGSCIIMGMAFLLERFGLLAGLSPWHVWPTLVIWGGLLTLVSARHGARVAWGIALLLIGATTQASYLGLLSLEPQSLWPVALVALGLFISVASLVGRRRFTEVPVVCSEGSIHRNLTFSGREERITTQAFEGGTISCTFGGIKLDLYGSEIAADEAVLEVDIVMGGIELLVPRHFRVVVDVQSTLGGVEDRSAAHDLSGQTKRLVIRGRIVLGGIEIKN